MADDTTRPDDTAEADAPQPVKPPPAPTVTPVPPAEVDTGYTPSGVPTFESVREKIETRYGTALGSAELDAETPEGRSVEEQYEARQRAAHDKLEEIRASMHNKDTGGTS
ncbi:MAG TPA: hypothetical protein VMD51_12460 [Mycobacterium sp.]|nr:hypothetical protein [Mycobacterium sp.]